MDVHKETITLAVAEGPGGGEVRAAAHSYSFLPFMDLQLQCREQPGLDRVGAFRGTRWNVFSNGNACGQVRRRNA